MRSIDTSSLSDKSPQQDEDNIRVIEKKSNCTWKVHHDQTCKVCLQETLEGLNVFINSIFFKYWSYFI